MEELSSIVSRVANETYGHSRRIMPEQPWWDNLEPSFHKFPDDFYLDILTRLGDAYAFSDLETMRVPFEDLTVSVVTPRMLYRMKRDTVRPKDRIDAEALRKEFHLEDE